MTDQADKIQWHPGFYGAAELELIDNKSELEFVRDLRECCSKISYIAHYAPDF